MFVKTYRYTVRKANFQKWKKNNDTTAKLYKQYGGKFQRLVKKKKDSFHILELGFYNSKKEFLQIIKQFDNDPKVGALFKDFLSLVHNKRFSEEEFETV